MYVDWLCMLWLECSIHYIHDHGIWWLAKRHSSCFSHHILCTWIGHATYSSVVGGMGQKRKSSVETIFCNCGQHPSWNQHTQVYPWHCVLQSAFQYFAVFSRCIFVVHHLHHFLCNVVWPNARIFLCLWHMRKAWAENAVKKITQIEEQTSLCQFVFQEKSPYFKRRWK